MLVAQRWAARQGDRAPAPMVAAPSVPMNTIVVAAAPLRFGTELGALELREIPWPQSAVPTGAFTSIRELLDGGMRRTALVAIEENEPILKTKITGPGQRASLSALIDPAMKAFTVRVNDVNGVAGFVLPGERVDVFLTRNLDGEGSWTDVLLQNIKVLAVDQSADERADKPAVAKAVTLEVTTAQAQRLTLASSIGALSLTLRSAGVVQREATQRISISNLIRDDIPAPAVAQAVETRPLRAAPTTNVTVVRALKREEYSVPVQPPGALPGDTAAKVSQRF